MANAAPMFAFQAHASGIHTKREAQLPDTLSNIDVL